jgi:hypothetical protein
MIHPVDLLVQEVEGAAHLVQEVEGQVPLAEPVVAHQDQQKAVHPVVAEVAHPAAEVQVAQVAAALPEEDHHVPIHPVAEAALLVVQSKAAPLAVAAVPLAVQSKAVHLAVRRKADLQERVHRADCYSSTNHFEISEVQLLSKH